LTLLYRLTYVCARATTATMHYDAIKLCRCQKYEAGQIEQSTTLSIT